MEERKIKIDKQDGVVDTLTLTKNVHNNELLIKLLTKAYGFVVIHSQEDYDTFLVTKEVYHGPRT